MMLRCLKGDLSRYYWYIFSVVIAWKINFDCISYQSSDWYDLLPTNLQLTVTSSIHNSVCLIYFQIYFHIKTLARLFVLCSWSIIISLENISPVQLTLVNLVLGGLPSSPITILIDPSNFRCFVIATVQLKYCAYAIVAMVCLQYTVPVLHGLLE